MAIHLSTPVGALPGIGTKALVDLRHLGIASVRDLLYYFPFRYDDFSKIVPIDQLNAGDTVTVVATLTDIHTRPSHKRQRMKITQATLEDATGTLSVVWFNQPYLERSLKPGMQLSVSGTVDNRYGLGLANPVHEPAGKQVSTGRIVPVYGLSGSLSHNRMRKAMKMALTAADELIDWLPADVLHRHKYPVLADAIEQIHFPDSNEALKIAIDRLKFNELFLHQLMFAQVRERQTQKAAHATAIDETTLSSYVESLPFTLTAGQKRAVWEIVQDTSQTVPMNRLLEGDVGSGKTVVAALASRHILKEQKSVVTYLAPTEILAAQQHEAFSRFIPGESIGLLTRSMAKIGGQDVAHTDVADQLREGTLRCVIGTHALLQERISIPDPTLVIIDEQHRFGVEQRHALLSGTEPVPHLLSMTATPIPRSLALTMYGDLDISILNEQPAGRKPVATALVSEVEQSGMWQHVRSQVEKGRQVFVVCPLIDPSDQLGARSVTEVLAELKSGPLKGHRLEALHGKLKKDKKQEIMRSFVEGNVQVLVSTTVVEVGVDVPNATVMVVIGPERFGLAQLHQLRGRVGRSDHQSYCYLLPESLTKHTEERLRALEKTNDGFRLAELDLEIRGPGNVFGNAQSGFPDFKLATPADVDLMKAAREDATELLGKDERLEQYPLVRDRVGIQFDTIHLE